MRQYKYLFLPSFLFFSIAAQAQRIKPSSRIEKASDSTYILLSDVDGKYQHTKLVAETGISFNMSNDTIYISATGTGGGGGGVTEISGGLGIAPNGPSTGSVSLSFDPTEFGTLSTLDGNEEMFGYSSIVGQPVKYDIQGVFSNVLNDQTNGIDFSESGSNQVNIDVDLQELSLGTTFDGAFLLLGNYGNSTERTVYFQDLLKNTLTSTDGSVTFTDNTFTLDLSASSGGGGTDDQTIDVFSFSSPTLSLSLENDGEATKTVDLSGLTSGLMDNFNIQADGGATTSITDNETINFDAGTNMTITRSGNTLLFESTGGGSGVSSVTVGTGLDGGGTGAVSIDFDLSELSLSTGYDYNDFLVGTTSTGTESRTNVLDMFDNTLTAGSGISLTNTGTSLQIAATGGGGGMTSFDLTDNGANTQVISDGDEFRLVEGVGLDITLGAITGGHDVDILLDLSELPDLASWDGDDYLAGRTTAGTESEGTLQEIFGDMLFSSDASVSIAYDGVSNRYDFTTSGGGGGMTSWTARTEDLVSTTVSDGTILDFEAGNGLKTQTSGGDVQILLDGPGLLNLGSITGAYELWVHSGVITGARSVQNILTDVLTSSDGSVTIGTSGNSVNLTATGSTDGDANWDDTSVYLSASAGADISSTTISSTHSDKRNFNVSLNATSSSTSNTQLLMPAASSTYQYHIFTVSCSDNHASLNCQISNTINGTYNMSDGELVVLRASQYEGSWTWFVN